MRKINCFIACSFGKSDIDELYNNCIVPVLKDLNVTPLRVDKINHNQNIDIKIIELIKNSDIGLVDLTYARPSVYFEAGYIEGLNNGVIYMVRKDHLSPREDDTFGNFKVHFDLITKNIIEWETVNYKLQIRLRKRLYLLLKPIQKSIKDSFTLKNKSIEWDMLSITNRILKINAVTNKVIQSHFNKKPFSTQGLAPFFVTYETRGKTNHIYIFIKETFNVKNIRSLRPIGDAWLYLKGIFNPPPTANKIVIIVSLKQLRKNSVMSGLSLCNKLKDSTYIHKDIITHKYIIIDNIINEDQYTDLIQKAFKKHISTTNKP